LAYFSKTIHLDFFKIDLILWFNFSRIILQAEGLRRYIFGRLTDILQNLVT